MSCVRKCPPGDAVTSESDAVPSEAAADDLDVSSAASTEEFARLLQRLRAHYGDPSMQELEDRSLAARSGRRAIPLSRATISAVLNGRRLAGHDFLISFLNALGVPMIDQQPWIEARARIAETQFPTDENIRPSLDESRHWPNSDLLGDFPNSAYPTDRARYLPAPPRYLPDTPAYPAQGQGPRNDRTAPAPPRRPRHWLRWILSGLLVLVVVAGALVLYQRSRPSPAASTLTCLPRSCAADAPSLVLNGRLTGDIPAGTHPHVLIQVHTTGNWFLGPAIVSTTNDGQWTEQLGLDELLGQATDRQFTICADLINTPSLQRLSELMALSSGKGVAVGDLPPDRIQLICKSASRVPNSN
jgi:transcriptional regulator with XRE-family HTH domain